MGSRFYSYRAGPAMQLHFPHYLFYITVCTSVLLYSVVIMPYSMCFVDLRAVFPSPLVLRRYCIGEKARETRVSLPSLAFLLAFILRVSVFFCFLEEWKHVCGIECELNGDIMVANTMSEFISIYIIIGHLEIGLSPRRGQ